MSNFYIVLTSKARMSGGGIHPTMIHCRPIGPYKTEGIARGMAKRHYAKSRDETFFVAQFADRKLAREYCTNYNDYMNDGCDREVKVQIIHDELQFMAVIANGSKIGTYVFDGLSDRVLTGKNRDDFAIHLQLLGYKVNK